MPLHADAQHAVLPALHLDLRPVGEQERWVVDGNYHRKLGELVLSRADLVVWLDLPVRVWLPRLAWRTLRRGITGEELWNGNRESLRTAVWGRDSLFVFALRTYRKRRAKWPARLAPYPYVRLTSPGEVQRFLERV